MAKERNPIRVLHVVTYMGRGGLETMLMNYYRHIDREKVQFDFLTHRSFEADYDEEIRRLGGKIYRLPRLNPVSCSYLRELDSFFKTHKEYKIVHSHLDCMAGIPLKYAARHGLPMRIAHAHNNNQAHDSKYLLKLYYKRMIPRYATDLFACAQEAGKWMFGTSSFQVLNNAIDVDLYRYNDKIRQVTRAQFGIKSTELLIGHVGRFAVQKNHAYLLEVFEALLKKRSDSYLLLVGDGELRASMEEKARLLGIKERVFFAGVRSDINNLLQAMDVFVFPSLFEGLGIANIEAQAAGLPVVISDRVPIECEKTKGLVSQLPLSAAPDTWADKILEAAVTEREDKSEEIRQAGFDIGVNASRLQAYYTDKMGDKYAED